jgi:hypothetical protein
VIGLPARASAAHRGRAVRPRRSAVPASLRQHPLLGMDNLTLAASVVLMLLQLRGGQLGEVAALVALPILAVGTFLADRRYLPSILVLCFPSAGVLVSPHAGVFSFPEVVSRVVLAGVEVPGTLMVLASAFARVCVELLMGGRAFRGVLPRPLILIYLLALGPAFLGALMAQGMGMNQWSVGMRCMLALGGLFWGVLVARNARGNPRRLVRQLCTVVVVAAALLVVRFLSDMFAFLVMGMAGGLIPFLVTRRRLFEAGILIVAALAGALALTLTTAAQVVVGLGCVLLASTTSPGTRRWIVRTTIAAGLVVSGGLIWLVSQLQGKTLLEVATTRDDGIVAYATVKLLGDRGPLWLAALQQISDGPYWIVPAGRPLRPENFNFGYLVYIWEFGAHNAFLELIRHVGLLAGAVGVGMIVYGFVVVVRVLAETRDPALRGLAGGVLGIALPGVTTGNFPVTDIGFFLWAAAGMVAATHLAMKAAEAAPAVEPARPPSARRPVAALAR